MAYLVAVCGHGVFRLGLTRADMTTLARNSFEASFLADADKRRWLRAIDAYARDAVLRSVVAGASSVHPRG